MPVIKNSTNQTGEGNGLAVDLEPEGSQSVQVMSLRRILVFFTTMLIGTATILAADAATKYRPCSLLTATDLETALHAKIGGSSERDQTISEGPYKGETMSRCDWVLGSGTGNVSLRVIRGRSPQEQVGPLATTVIRATIETIEEGRKKDWTIEPGNIPGADCASLKPPASEPTALPGASCIMVSKGIWFGLYVFSKGPVTAQDVKALGDKVAARLP